MLSLALAVPLVFLTASVPGQERRLVSPRGTVIGGGSVSGTWTEAGSPYLVRGDIVVGTLVVEAGVEVRSAPGVEIRVAGSITTLGTAQEPVLFTSRTPTETWKTLRLLFATGVSSFAYTRIEHAAGTGLDVQASPVSTVSHCEFVDNARGVIISSDGDYSLEDCLIADNTSVQINTSTGAGIYVNVTGAFTMERCTVRGNRALALPCGYAGGGGIHVIQAEEVFLTDLLVEDNECLAATGLLPICSACSPSAGGGGISLGCFGSTLFCSPQPDFDATLTRCVVRNNRAIAKIEEMTDCTPVVLRAEGGGISYGGFHATLVLRNVVVAGNVAWADGDTQDSEGAGVFFEGGTLSATNCTIARNVAVDGQSVPGPSGGLSPGIHLLSGTSEIRNSVLYENMVCTTTEPPSSAGCIGAMVVGDPLQGPGGVAVVYSDVQGGQAGTGNLDLSPVFSGHDTTYADLSVAPGSPCVDAGHPNGLYSDTSFPPSLGGFRNDMGHNGGPLAGGWLSATR